MANPTLPEPPAQLKAVQTYMKVAADVERIDSTTAYWTRLYSIEMALKIDKNSPECKKFLTELIFCLEKFKESHKDNEAVTNETVGQAHVENFVVSLFTKADTMDRNGIANKTTVRMFFMSAILFEAMEVFGPLTEEIQQKAKYAKFKAAYIQKCLKNGETPVPGPLDGSESQAKPQDGAPPPSDTLPSESVASGASQGNSDLQIPEVPTDDPAHDSLKKDPFILTPTNPVYPPQLPSNTSMTKPLTPSPMPPTVTPKAPVAPPPASSSSYSGAIGGSTILSTNYQATNGAPLNPEDLLKSQKYCKFANSALQYDDIPTAVANLEKALKLLTTGQRSD